MSILLKKWIADYSYMNVAYDNIFIKNADSKSLLEFLVDKVQEKKALDIHFTNLELLFQLFRRLSENVGDLGILLVMEVTLGFNLQFDKSGYLRFVSILR